MDYVSKAFGPLVLVLMSVLSLAPSTQPAPGPIVYEAAPDVAPVPGPTTEESKTIAILENRVAALSEELRNTKAENSRLMREAATQQQAPMKQLTPQQAPMKQTSVDDYFTSGPFSLCGPGTACGAAARRSSRTYYVTNSGQTYYSSNGYRSYRSYGNSGRVRGQPARNLGRGLKALLCH